MTDDYRLQNLEQDVQGLSDLPARVAVLETDQRTMGREISELKTALKDGLTELKEDGKQTRRVLLAFALTIAASAIGVVFAVLSAGGAA